jgi:hypothetical protein
MSGEERSEWWRQHGLDELRDLLNEWDPIGVMDEPDWPDNEYESLIAPLRERLDGGTTAGALEVYLEEYVRDHIGVDPDVDRESRLASRLVDWYSAAGGGAPER